MNDIGANEIVAILAIYAGSMTMLFVGAAIKIHELRRLRADDRFQMDCARAKVDEYQERFDRLKLETDLRAELESIENRELREALHAAGERYEEVARDRIALKDRLASAMAWKADSEEATRQLRALESSTSETIARLKAERDSRPADRSDLDACIAERDRLREETGRLVMEWRKTEAERDDLAADLSGCRDACTELRAELDEWKAKGRGWAHLAGVTRDTAERIRAQIAGKIPGDAPILVSIKSCKVLSDDHK